MDELRGYDLSRDWFDFCFENPELVKPTHIALYFFAIEHCNRLGWKPKFGLPTQMTMDAIGVKNWRTYSKAFDDIVEWGFFKLIEKSKNQYSATVIAIVKNTKANTKALSKAMQKHSQKQSSSTAVINKPITNNQEPENNPLIPQGENENTDEVLNWKNDFNVYLKELRSDFKQITSDKDWIAQQEKFNPGVDIKLSIEKACSNYWAKEGGWKKKKRAKITNIDWKSTFANAVSQPMNRVYKDRINSFTSEKVKEPFKPEKW